MKFWEAMKALEEGKKVIGDDCNNILSINEHGDVVWDNSNDILIVNESVLNRECYKIEVELKEGTIFKDADGDLTTVLKIIDDKVIGYWTDTDGEVYSVDCSVKRVRKFLNENN